MRIESKEIGAKRLLCMGRVLTASNQMERSWKALRRAVNIEMNVLKEMWLAERIWKIMKFTRLKFRCTVLCPIQLLSQFAYFYREIYTFLDLIKRFTFYTGHACFVQTAWIEYKIIFGRMVKWWPHLFVEVTLNFVASTWMNMLLRFCLFASTIYGAFFAFIHLIFRLARKNQ